MFTRESLHSAPSLPSTLSLSNEQGFAIADSLSEVWSKLEDSTIAGVVLKRESMEWDVVLAEVDQHFNASAKGIFLTQALSAHPQLLDEYLQSTGFTEKFPQSAKILLEDMCRLLKFISCVNETRQDQIASGVAWMHQDPKGVHVDQGPALVCVVSYLGPGPLCYSASDVVDRTKVEHLQLRPNSPVFRTPKNWPAFMKGRVDLNRSAGPDNFGLPHGSPSASDPIYGFDQRLIFAVQAYGLHMAAPRLFGEGILGY